MKSYLAPLSLALLAAASIHCGGAVDSPPAAEADEAEATVATRPTNFRVVTEGVLSAGAHPFTNNVRYLRDNGVRTVLSLQDPIEESAWPVKNNGKMQTDIVCNWFKGFCEQQHVRSDKMAFAERIWRVVVPPEVKSEKWVDDTLAIIAKQENQPVYIHCAYGLDRTGAIIALHRVFNEGRTAKEAFAEWRGASKMACISSKSWTKTFVNRIHAASTKTGDPRFADPRFEFSLDDECAKPVDAPFVNVETPPKGEEKP